MAVMIHMLEDIKLQNKGYYANAALNVCIRDRFVLWGLGQASDEITGLCSMQEAMKNPSWCIV